MTLLVLELVVFFAVHLFTAVRPARASLLAILGANAYRGAYSVGSLIGFVLIVWEFVRYRTLEYSTVYVPVPGLRHAAMGLILVAFILLAAANMPAGHIKSTLRHPMVTGVALWAAAHLLVNGDVGGILLFGAFLAYSAVFFLSLLARDPVELAPPNWRFDLRAVIGGTLIYLLFVFVIHPYVFQIPVVG